jgi:UDP-2,4-diacetamido-2,4,6-trideoxy-beta-L-altropyranose hydrolase
MEISVRKADVRDTDDIHRWRDHPPSRAMYLSTDEIPLESHRRWFFASLEDPLRHMYIGEISNEKIGICRFDIGLDSDTAEVFLTLNPAMCGKKLSGQFLLAATNAFFASGVATRRLWAKIRVGNTPSIRCFTALGFVPAGGDGVWNFYVWRVAGDAT